MTTQTLTPARPARTIMRAFGINWTATASAWVFFVLRLLIGLLTAFIVAPQTTMTATIGIGLGFGTLLLIVEVVHVAGHWLTARITPDAQIEARVTALFIETHYTATDEREASYVVLVRAWGGPLLSTLVGTGSLLLWLNTGGLALLFFALANKTLFALNLLPIKPLDGAIIWRETPRVFNPSR